MVIVEAMALGVAVVSTDCPNGPREILEDSRCGPLVPVEDHDSLAKAIVKAFGGDIRVKSTVNQGSSFLVSLPS